MANRGINPGEKIAREDISIKRPGTGIAPKYLDLVIGTRASRRIEEDQVLQWDDILRRE